jgi:signal transduction histidine kinase
LIERAVRAARGRVQNARGANGDITMTDPSPARFERNIARCRLVLSGVAIIAVFVDPTHPLFSRWYELRGGHFAIDPAVLAAMGTYFLYSLLVLAALHRQLAPQPWIAVATTWGDVAFGAMIAILTEGASSPFYPFFAFAVLQTGLRSGLRQTMVVTSVSVALYLGLILVSSPGDENVYIMRPVYLAITGYLVGYLGEQRLQLETEIPEMAASDQRTQIARDLHDGCVQSLAGVNLRLERCRRLLQAGRAGDAATDLADLQTSVTSEYDHLRSYMRALAELNPSAVHEPIPREPHVNLSAHLSGSATFADHVLQLVREGLANVRKHAHAHLVDLRVETGEAGVQIHITDDGIGFADGTGTPWSMSQRVRDLGGEIQIVQEPRPGAHLAIMLPQVTAS